MRAWLGAACLSILLVASPALAQTPAACAEDAFALAELDAAGVQFELDRMSPPNLADPAAIDLFVQQLATASEHVQRVARVYQNVVDCRSPEWTLAAYTRQGQIYEALADAVRRALGHAPGRARAALEPQLGPIACLAIVRYVLAVRVTRISGSPPTRYARTALDRLVHYEFRVASQCVQEQIARDSTFQPLTLADMAPYREPAAVP